MAIFRKTLSLHTSVGYDNIPSKFHYQGPGLWDNAIFDKHHEVRPLIKVDYPVVQSLRREDVVLTRLRIGHTHITHSHLLKRVEQPQCVSCNEPFTVKHFLLDCVDFLDIRKQYFSVRNFKQLFSDVPADKILSYLKEIHLFNKI